MNQAPNSMSYHILRKLFGNFWIHMKDLKGLFNKITTKCEFKIKEKIICCLQLNWIELQLKGLRVLSQKFRKNSVKKIVLSP